MLRTGYRSTVAAIRARSTASRNLVTRDGRHCRHGKPMPELPVRAARRRQFSPPRRPRPSRALAGIRAATSRPPPRDRPTRARSTLFVAQTAPGKSTLPHPSRAAPPRRTLRAKNITLRAEHTASRPSSSPPLEAASAWASSARIAISTHRSFLESELSAREPSRLLFEDTGLAVPRHSTGGLSGRALGRGAAWRPGFGARIDGLYREILRPSALARAASSPRIARALARRRGLAEFSTSPRVADSAEVRSHLSRFWAALPPAPRLDPVYRLQSPTMLRRTARVLGPTRVTVPARRHDRRYLRYEGVRANPPG